MDEIEKELPLEAYEQELANMDKTIEKYYYTEELLDDMSKYDLMKLSGKLGLSNFIPKNSRKSLIVDTILESQEEVKGS